MKKLKYFSFIGLVVMALVALVMPLASCNNKAGLDTPTITSLDVNYKMKWTSVENARVYTIEVSGVENGYYNEVQIRKTNYSLAKLEEGDYEVRIKAIGGEDNSLSSAWSEVYSFHRDYESGCVYTLINNDTEYKVAKSGSASGEVFIDSTYRGKPVTEIGDAAFKGNGRVEKIVLSEGIRTIGDNAFYNCSALKELNIPSTVTSIGKSAFQSCRMLESLEIPSKVTVINDYTFAYCRSLKTLILPDTITYIGESAITDCSALTEITLPSALTYLGTYALSADVLLESITIPAGLEKLSENLFFGCTNLTQVNFATDGKLTELGDSSFEGCVSLQSITLPEGLEVIGNRAFNGCEKLDTIVIPDSVNKIGYYVFNVTKLYTDATAAGDQFIYAGNWVVAYNTSTAQTNPLTMIKTTTFKDGTRGIASAVFYNLPTLTSVKLNASIKVIGEYCFAYCDSLWQFTSPENGVEYIWDKAFLGDAVLTQASMKSGLKHIGSRAFYNCTILDNNEMADSLVPDTVTEVGTYAFFGTSLWNSPDEYGVIYAGDWVVGCTNNTSIVILNDGVVGVSNYAFYKCDNVTSVVGLNSAKYIGYGAFMYCTALSTVQLNKNLKKIDDYTFYGCQSLFSVTIPATLNTVGERAFYGCTKLNEVDFAKSKLATIGVSAFSGCTYLQTVTFPTKTLTTISDNAFYKCDVLKGIAIPDTVTYLGEKAFYKCNALETLTIGTGVTEIKESTFSGCLVLKEINIPGNVKTIGKSAFYNCQSAEVVTLAEGIENIGSYAFFNGIVVEELALPSTVKTIGAYAFKGWNTISYVFLSKDIETISQHAFYGCKHLTFYTDAAEKPADWHKIFNSSYRPVIYGTVMSEDNSYVVSFTTGENVLNLQAQNGVTDPVRVGYTFGGWSAEVTDEEGNKKTVTYTSKEISEVAEGTVLTAIWNAIE